MAMYVFQELSPKVFYFTYCLQEIGKYIGYIEKSETDLNINNNLISKWNLSEAGVVKTFSSNFINEKKPIDGKTLFLINNFL